MNAFNFVLTPKCRLSHTWTASSTRRSRAALYPAEATKSVAWVSAACSNPERDTTRVIQTCQPPLREGYPGGAFSCLLRYQPDSCRVGNWRGSGRWSGKGVASLSPPPLRTVREGLPSHGSSKPVTDWLPQMARPLMAGVLALFAASPLHPTSTRISHLCHLLIRWGRRPCLDRLRAKCPGPGSGSGRRSEVAATRDRCKFPTGNSPPTRGIFLGYSGNSGALRGPGAQNRESPVSTRVSDAVKVYI